ncbi:MAG: exo-alpha-sialidase [Clostridia bacterium]|nr:exo-alpha-sialidase [Clostridia bacterium]
MAMMLLAGCGQTDSTATTTAGGEATTTTDAAETDTVTTTTISSKSSNQSQKPTSSKVTTTTTEFVIENTVTTFKRINPERSAKETAQLINNNLSAPATKIASEKSLVWYPKSADEWTYSHHVSVAVFKGKVYVTWSNGRVNEDDCGQRIMYSYSSDFKTWSTPKTLPFGQTEVGQYAEVVKLNGYLYTHGGKLYASFGSSEYLPDNMMGPNVRPYQDEPRVNYESYLISTTDGVNWTREIGGVGISRPPSLVTKRCFNIGSEGTLSFTDDPSGRTGWDSGAVSGNMENIKKEYGISLICEGTSYQTADGIVRAMWRTDCDYILMAESYNNGVTFTRPYMTKFKNGYSMFVFGHLNDGRTFCIYNPTGRERNPLSIVLSEDGINFNKEYTLRDETQWQQFTGLWKGGDYGYPKYFIDGDYMYIAYSIEKEGVEVTRIKISDLK